MSSAIIKGLLSRSVRLPNSPYCLEPSRLCAGPQLQLPLFPHLLPRRLPIATGLLYDLHICACCECVLLIKMTCAVNWIIVRERRAESTSPSHPDLAGSRGKTVSGHLELSPDAVDDITSFVPCHALHAPQHAAASTFGPLNHSNDFRPSCRSRLYITGTGKSRYAGFCLELPTPRWIADQGWRAPSTLDIATQILLTAI